MIRALLFLVVFVSSSVALSCQLNQVGDSCSVHATCDEIAAIIYADHQCDIGQSRKQAFCSAVVLNLSLQNLEGGEDCRITIKSEEE